MSHFKHLFPLKPERKKKKPIQVILNNIGLRDDDPLHIKKKLSMYKCMVNHRFWSTDSTNPRLCSSVVWIHWKNNLYKWTHAVQNCVVQGSAVIPIITVPYSMFVMRESAFVFYSGLHLTGWDPLISCRVICSTRPANANVYLV